jgi:hypothetical protein
MFDRTQAEEALLIAARLQQEHREQYSLSDLKKTASEVDISPEFVEQAIRMVQTQEPVAPVVATPQRSGQVSVLVHLVLGLLVLPAEFIVVGLACIPKQLPMAWPFALALTGFLAWKLPKGRVVTRTGATYLVVGFLALLGFAVWAMQGADWYGSFGLLVFMAILQTSVYVWIRWLVDAHPRPVLTWRSEAPNQTSGVQDQRMAQPRGVSPGPDRR